LIVLALAGDSTMSRFFAMWLGVPGVHARPFLNGRLFIVGSTPT